MKKRMVLLICMLCIGLCFTKTSMAAEKSDQANSFRYENGQPIQKDQQERLKPFFLSNDPLPYSKVDGYYLNSALEPIEGAISKGIDVSHHQKEIDWSLVKESDVEFAIIRCGYGQDLESQDDKYWFANADACTEYDIPFGTYLYSYADTPEKAIGEANHVLRLVEGYNLSYPIYYDLEDASLRDLSPEELGEIASAFCETIESAGYEAGIYANTDWFTNRLTDPVFENWDRWVAQYNTACTYSGSYSMWQCTSSGSVPGVNGNTDINFIMEGGNLSPESVRIGRTSSFTYTPVSTSSVKLTWNKVPGADGYTIYRYDSSTKENIPIKNPAGTTTSYKVTKTMGIYGGSSLKAGTGYTFRIAAFKKADGEKIYGDMVTLRTLTKPKKIIWTSLKRTGTKASLSWKENTTGKGYVIYLSYNENSGYKPYKTITSNKTTSLTVTGLKRGQPCYFKIASYKPLEGNTVYGDYSNVKMRK